MRKTILALALCLLSLPASARMQGSGAFIRGLGRTTTAAAAGGGAFASDAFTRADGDLTGDSADTGGTWDDPCDGACADFLVATNQIVSNNASDWNAYTVSAVPPSAEYYSQATIFVTDAARTSMGPAVQILDNNNFIGCAWNGGDGDWNIIKYSGGTEGLVDDGEITNPPSTARTVKLTRSGTTYTCTSDGSTVASGTDATFSNAEKAGLMSNFTDTDSTADNFEAGQ